MSGATFGLAQTAGAGAIAAGAASGGAGGALSGGATAWKNGGDAGDIARAALIHGLGGALGGGIAGRFGVSTATMSAGRVLSDNYITPSTTTTSPHRSMLKWG